jgi:hypothetical protein
MSDILSVADLTHAIKTATEGGGAWGQNMDPSKDVLIEMAGRHYSLSRISASFVGTTGRFALVLEAGDQL